MSSDREERIRNRAHEIWEQEGRPEGREGQHWDQAAREIEEEGGMGQGSGGMPGEVQPGAPMGQGKAKAGADGRSAAKPSGATKRPGRKSTQ